jgi:endoglucanase
MVDVWPVNMAAFNIDGHNFFMFRDVSFALWNPTARFDVYWYGARGAITIDTGRWTYAVQTSDLLPVENVVMAVPSTAVVYVDGSRVNLRAYNIEGRNFFMLRDLGDALGFDVDWDGDANVVQIDTSATQREFAQILPILSEPTPAPEEEYEPEEESEPDEYCGMEEIEIEPPAEFNAITATEWVSRVRVGWNLGNQLDSRTERGGTLRQLETAWVPSIVTPGLISAVYEAGFNAIRIPITWQKAIDDDFTIREDWMARVREIVGYAVSQDMYIMINTHHDDEIFRLHDRYMAESRHATIRIWEQIATEFESYSEKLVFQGFNEPRTRGSPAEWSGGTSEERANLNALNQLFVDTVRATGGNNAERVLVIPTYAASASAAAQEGLVVPRDTVPDRIIVSMHHYSPWLFALYTGDRGTRSWSASNNYDTSPINTYIRRAYNTFVRNGIPVMFTEAGAINRDNTDARVAWTEFYFSQSAERGIPVWWWDNSQSGVYQRGAGGAGETFGLFNRSTGEQTHPEIIDAIMRSIE